MARYQIPSSLFLILTQSLLAIGYRVFLRRAFRAPHLIKTSAGILSLPLVHVFPTHPFCASPCRPPPCSSSSSSGELLSRCWFNGPPHTLNLCAFFSSIPGFLLLFSNCLTGFWRLDVLPVRCADRMCLFQITSPRVAPGLSLEAALFGLFLMSLPFFLTPSFELVPCSLADPRLLSLR